jgi:hypothetical protein
MDFAAGVTLQLSGHATVRWGAETTAGDDALTGRCVEFVPQQVITTSMPALHETDHAPYPENPPLIRGQKTND